MSDEIKRDEAIKQFEQKAIRTAWDEKQEEWYFSVVDVVGVLSDSADPTDYLKKMRKRDEQLGRLHRDKLSPGSDADSERKTAENAGCHY